MMVKKGDYAWRASVEFPAGGDERIVLRASRIEQASEKQIKVRSSIHRPRAGGWSPPLYFTPEDAMQAFTEGQERVRDSALRTVASANKWLAAVDADDVVRIEPTSTT